MTAKAFKVFLSGDEEPKRIKLDRPDFDDVTKELRRRFNLEQNISLAAVVIEDDKREEYSITTSDDLKDSWDDIKELHVYVKNQADLTVAIEHRRIDPVQGFKIVVEDYKVDEIPITSTLVVLDVIHQTGRFNAFLNVNKSFRRVGKIVNASFFAAVATGNAEMQAGAKELGLNAIKICDDADNTMEMYVVACDTVTRNVLTAIEHLKENDYNEAIHMFSTLVDTAKQCVEKTDYLISIIDEVSKSGMVSEKTSTKILTEREAFEEYSEKMTQVHSAFTPGVSKKTKFLKKCTLPLALAAKHAVEVVNIISPGYSIPAAIISTLFTLVDEIVPSEEQDRLQRTKGESEQLRKDLDDLRINIQDAENRTKYLHILYGQLLEMKSDLKVMRKFFNGLVVCWNASRISEEEITKQAESTGQAHDCKKDVCSKLLGSVEFKRKVVMYQAKWVALGAICETGGAAARYASKELHEVIKQNPTKQEAGKQVDAMIEAAKDA